MESFDKKNEDDDYIVRNKSNFTPYKGKDKYLDTYIDTISKFPISTPKWKQNLRKEEKEGFTDIDE